nr:cache domain-containing protein [Clostridiales bacterium]
MKNIAKKNGHIRSISKRLIVLGYVTVLCTTIILSAFNLGMLVMNLKNRAYEQTDMLAISYAQSLENVMTRVYDELGIIATNKEIAQQYVTLDKAALENYLIGADKKSGKTSEYMFYSISLIDPSGKTYDGYDLSKRSYVQKALSGQANLSAPVFSAKDKINTYYAAQKMNNGIADGAVFVGLNIDFFYNVIKGYEESNDYGGKAFVVNKDGQIVVCSNQDILSDGVNPITLVKNGKIEKENPNGTYNAKDYEGMAKLVEEMVKGGTDHTKFTYSDGKSYYVSYKPVQGPSGTDDGWSIAVLVPTKVVTSDFVSALISSIVLVIISVAVVTI